MKKKGLKITGAIIIVISLIFLLGPREKAPKLSFELSDSLTNDLEILENFINQRELNTPNLKTDNHARILWANYDSISKTEYVFIYIHGFSASPIEGNGIYNELKNRYNANVYLPRLQAHGIETENNLLDFDIAETWESAKEAYLIGKKLGSKVILVGTSTGATLSLMLAAEYPDIEALVLYSPNIDLYDKKSELLTFPWGLQIIRLFMNSKYREFEITIEAQRQYWQYRYRLEALVKLKVMLKTYMRDELFSKITQPVFVGYYFKNEEEKDKTISIEAIENMFENLGTANDKKTKVAFANAGRHVLTWLPTANAIEDVRKETFDFLENKVGVK